MPLMIDPSSGSLLYGQDVSVYTFDLPSATSYETTLLATALGTAPTTSTSVANVVVTASAAAVSKVTSMNATLAEQAAIQSGMDNTTPRNLMIAFAALLFLCIAVSHTRFLGRLFASLPRRRRNDGTGPMPLYLGEKAQRVVGGGDLRTGWILQSGLPAANPPPYSIKANPFDTLSTKSITSTSKLPTYLPPPHITLLLSHLPFNPTLLTPLTRLGSSITLAEIYIILSYLLLIAFAMIWKSDVTPATAAKGYGSDFARTGLVALVHVPIVVALGVRGNIIGLCVGKGYERLKVYHKIVGRVLFLSATLHVAFFIHKWAIAGTLSSFSKPFIIYGTVAWVAIVMIAITSLPVVRNACHGVFKICHFIGMIGLFVGLAMHVTVAVPFCVAALFIYLISLLSSILKTRFAHAELITLSGSSTTVITIPALRTGWRAGQHVRIRIPALGFPLGFEAHPFTIASAPDGDGMVLMAKSAGDWTTKLYDYADREESTRLASSTLVHEATATATVILEGPYGGLGNTVLSSFSSVVCIAGGSGITHALSSAHDLITRAPTGSVRARVIDLIWVVRTQEAAQAVMPTLLDLVDEARSFESKCIEERRRGLDLPTPTGLRVTIYVTRCPSSSPLTLLDEAAYEPDDILEDRIRIPRKGYTEADMEKRAYLSRNPSSSSTATSSSSGASIYGAKMGTGPISSIDARSIRPDFEVILENIVDATLERQTRERVEASGVGVTVCGPRGLCTAVRSGVMAMEGWKRRGCGGVELVEESFGF